VRPLRYSINITLDGCCDHRAVLAYDEMHRHHTEKLAQADALLLGRVTYEMMETAWRPFAQTGVRPDWMEPSMESFALTVKAYRLEVREPVGVGLGVRGNAVCSDRVVL
jgi:hypothetical protein